MKSVLGDYMKSVIWWGEINLFWGGNGNLAGEGEGHYWKGGGGVPPPFSVGVKNYLAPDQRNLLLNTAVKYQKKIMKWECESCPCRMCKTGLQHISFIS